MECTKDDSKGRLYAIGINPDNDYDWAHPSNVPFEDQFLLATGEQSHPHLTVCSQLPDDLEAIVTNRVFLEAE